jgi:hypothetical protein
MKSQKQIEAAEKEMFDRRWYERSLLFQAKDGYSIPQAVKEREKVEEEYGKDNLGPYDDFSWGMLAGKHAALRWVLDNEVTWDDDSLGDT